MEKACLLLLLSLTTSTVVAEDWSLSGKMGSSGYSLEWVHPLSTSNHLNGRVSTYLLNYSDDSTESANEHGASMDLGSAGVLLDWHPGGSSFRFTVGGYYNGNEADLDAKSITGTFDINAVHNATADVGLLRADTAYGSSAPYLGIGWGNITAARSGWGMAWDLGVLYQSDPDVGLGVSCTPNLTGGQCDNLSDAAEPQALTTESEANKWNPVLSLDILYRF